MTIPGTTDQAQSLLDAYRPLSPSRGNSVAGTTRALREAILDGVLEPGSWLREESMARSFGVSRTPIREAFNRLEDEGLVTRDRNAGARVAPLTLEDMSAVYAVRGSLESLAAKLAAERRRPEIVAGLRRSHEQMLVLVRAGNAETLVKENVEFHRLLAEGANNAYLRRFSRVVEIGLRRFGPRSYSRERMDELCREHEAVLVAIERGDGPGAATAATAHADRAREVTLARMLDLRT